MISTSCAFEDNEYEQLLEGIAFTAVMEDNDELVKAMCDYIDNSNNLVFEEVLDECMTDYVFETILFEEETDVSKPKKIKKKKRTSEFNPLLTTKEQIDADTEGFKEKMRRDTIGSNIARGKDVTFKPETRKGQKERKQKTIKHKGVLRRMVERFGKRTPDIIKRGIKRGLKTKLGQKVVGAGLKMSKKMIKKQALKMAKASQAAQEAKRGTERMKIKYNKGGWKEKTRQFLTSKGPVALGFAGKGVKHPVGKVALGVGSKLMSFGDSEPSYNVKSERKKHLKAARKLHTGKTLYRTFKKLQTSKK